MSDKYILRGHTPRKVDDLLEWAKWMETGNRVVKQETVEIKRIGIGKAEIVKCDVSTVFLGIDHAFGVGPPLLFETMVFGGPIDDRCERCSTWAEAEEQHRRIVEEVRKHSVL